MAEEGIPMHSLAEVISYIMNLPATRIAAKDAKTHFGWMSMLIEYDMSASNIRPRERLPGKSTDPGLIDNLLMARTVSNNPT